MGIGASKINEIRGEIGQLQGQEQQMSQAEGSLENAKRSISEKISEVKGNLAKLYEGMEKLKGYPIPEDAPEDVKERIRGQIQEQKVRLAEQISMLKNAYASLRSQLNDIEGRKSFIKEKKDQIGQGVAARKQALMTIASRMSMMNGASRPGDREGRAKTSKG